MRVAQKLYLASKFPRFRQSTINKIEVMEILREVMAPPQFYTPNLAIITMLKILFLFCVHSFVFGGVLQPFVCECLLWGVHLKAHTVAASSWLSFHHPSHNLILSTILKRPSVFPSVPASKIKVFLQPQFSPILTKFIQHVYTKKKSVSYKVVKLVAMATIFLFKH